MSVFLPHRNGLETTRLSSRRPSIVTVLDVGSTKIACLIARLKPRPPEEVLPGRSHSIEVVGYGYQRARGIKSGVVIDLDQAEHAVRLAVDAAERMAGVTVESLILTQTCGRLGSETFTAKVDLAGESVGDNDIRKVLAAGSTHSVRQGRSVVHALPIGYTLDGQRGIRDPRGMVGSRLGVDVHVVTSDEAPQRNLSLTVNRCHLDVEAMVATPYASGLATLVDDEAELGAAVVDIGGGTSSIAVFADGRLIHVDAIAIGGHHVTLDIANGLSIRVDDAERLKTLHGSCVSVSSDEYDMLTIHPVGEEDGGAPLQVPRAALNGIIRPRAEEILELVRDRLVASGCSSRVGRRIVLTGGGSQLTGLLDVARSQFGRSVRLGRPLGIAGLPQAAKGPSFAAVVGLLIFPQVAVLDTAGSERASTFALTGTDGYFARVGRWLRESF